MSEEMEQLAGVLADVPEPLATGVPALGVYVEPDSTRDEAVLNYVGFLGPLMRQMREDRTITDVINEALLLTPKSLEALTIAQVNHYLVMLPKGMMWLQECLNRAQIKLNGAEDQFEDVIAMPSALLTKEAFGKGTTTITKEMRLAKMRDTYPDKYAELIKAVREKKNIVTRLDGQIKHLQTLNDNLKKVRDSFVASA
jgi:hypothetical protein